MTIVIITILHRHTLWNVKSVWLDETGCIVTYTDRSDFHIKHEVIRIERK